MSVNTIMLDFFCDFNEKSNGDLLKQQKSITNEIKTILEVYISNLKYISSIELSDSLTTIYSGDLSSFITVRCFTNGTLTINIEYISHKEGVVFIDYQTTKKIKKIIQDKITKNQYGHNYPIIQKDPKFLRYMTTSDLRLIEYDIDNILFEEVSNYQKVQILHSKSLGNLLVLDELQNISESDLIYTETLMRKNVENYKDKEIIILGGGDGALLYEILKEQPKFVTLLELDEVVIKACKQFMRSCCGNVLDKYEETNYKIIIGDCFESLTRMISLGNKVDYIFGDLTDFPVTPDEETEVWDFILNVLNTSLKLLKPSGKFMTQGGGKLNPDMLKLYEQQLNKLDIPVEYKSESKFIPSFDEEWVFYQIWPKEH